MASCESERRQKDASSEFSYQLPLACKRVRSYQSLWHILACLKCSKTCYPGLIVRSPCILCFIPIDWKNISSCSIHLCMGVCLNRKQPCFKLLSRAKYLFVPSLSSNSQLRYVYIVKRVSLSQCRI